MADETSKPRLSRATAQPASRSSGDPLAELARLIGRDEVFQQMRDEATRTKPAAPAAERAPAPWLARPRDPRQELRGSQGPSEERPAESRGQATPIRPGLIPAARQQAEVPPAAPVRAMAPAQPEPAYDHGYDAPATQPAYEPEAAYDAFEDQGARSPEPVAAHEAYHETYDDQAYYEDDPDAYAADMPPPRRRRTGMWAVAAVLGVAVVGTAGAFGYRAMTGGSSESQVPIIKADTAPAKLVPPAPAKDPQSRTASLDRNGRGQPERLVSNEEQPVDLDAKLAAARASAASATTGAISPTGSQPSMMSLASAPPAAAAADAGTPKKVRTISIRPDGTMASPPAGAGKVANATDSAARLPGDMAGRPAAASRAPASQAAPAADTARPTRSASLGAPAPTQTTPAAVPVTGPMVQLASQKSEADAHSAYRALQAKYPNILSGRQATIKRVEIADKGTFYRAQVGPFASTDQASDFCNSLKAVGGQCIVQRN